MGATAGYCRPVQPTGGRISSWTAHRNRGVPSVEPGTDYYCPRGTPVRAAAAGRVVDVGDSIQPATGRYVTIDLDDGRRVRYLHLERRHVGVGQRVQWGQHIADSGATGYGEADWSWNVAETGGAHVHMTLWSTHRYEFNKDATLDPELYMSSNQGGGSTNQSEEDEEMLMLKIQAGKSQHYAALGNGVFKHFKQGEPYDKVMRVSRARDDWQTIDISELPTFLATYGCDRNIWDFRTDKGESVSYADPKAKFMVLDPITGKVASGNTWSAVGALRAAKK